VAANTGPPFRFLVLQRQYGGPVPLNCIVVPLTLDEDEPMADDSLFLENEHPASHRLAVLEDDGTAVWLYLTEPHSRKPAADAWVYNRIAAPPPTAIESYRGGPPPAAQGYVSEAALCNDPTAHQWSFLWSADGEAVAVAKDGEPVAFIVIGKPGGYSRELVKDGPWGHPWSAILFRSTFGAA
jgi:hypothetical protein